MKTFSFKKFVLLISIVVVFVTSLCLFNTIHVKNTSNNDIDSINLNTNINSQNAKTIVVDAGHGGMDIGAMGKIIGLKESTVNLKIAKALKNVLLSNGYNVVMTRETEDGLYGDTSKGHKRRDMKKRKEIIGGSFASVLVSIHLNTCPYTYRKGAIAFYKPNDENSKALANCIQEKLNNNLYGMEKEQICKGDFFILNCTKKPAVLVECGFLSNQEEEQNLANDKYLQKIAETIFSGIDSFLASVNQA